MPTCTHKTIADHSRMASVAQMNAIRGAPVGVRKGDRPRRWWTCSVCGTEATWGPSWGYYGRLECRRCGFDVIGWVACSDACWRKRANG